MVSACGGDGDSAAKDAAGSGGVPSNVATPGAGSANSDVPDACKALSAADLKAAFGTEPGPGTAAGGGSRNICTYSSGAIVGISDGDQYSFYVTTAKGIKDAKCEDVSGVGDDGFFCVLFGSGGQFGFKDGALMYDITAPSKDVAAYKQLAAKLLN